MKLLNDLIFLFRTGLVQQPYITKRKYPKKTMKDFAPGDTFIVAGFTAAGNPICQMVPDMQNDMKMGGTNDETFFMFGKSSIGAFQMKKTYRLVKLDQEGTVAWQQVTLFIEANCVVG